MSTPWEKAFQAFVVQTEKAKTDGWIYTEDLQKLLDDAQSNAFWIPPRTKPMSTKAKASMWSNNNVRSGKEQAGYRLHGDTCYISAGSFQKGGPHLP